MLRASISGPTAVKVPRSDSTNGDKYWCGSGLDQDGLCKKFINNYIDSDDDPFDLNESKMEVCSTKNNPNTLSDISSSAVIDRTIPSAATILVKSSGTAEKSKYTVNSTNAEHKNSNNASRNMSATASDIKAISERKETDVCSISKDYVLEYDADYDSCDLSSDSSQSEDEIEEDLIDREDLLLNDGDDDYYPSGDESSTDDSRLFEKASHSRHT